jgi:hypothetical protein
VEKKMMGRRRRRESAVPGRAAAVPIEVLYNCSGIFRSGSQKKETIGPLKAFHRGFFRVDYRSRKRIQI